MADKTKFLFLLLFFAKTILFAYEEKPLSQEWLKMAEEWDKESAEANKAYDTYYKYVNEIVDAFTQTMKNELNLVCNGTSHMMHSKVEQIGLSFDAKKRVTIEEARAIHLYAINKLAQIVNAHEKIQPFLKEQPFSHKSISIGISYNCIRNWNFDGSPTYVSNVSDQDCALKENRNNIFYRAADPFTWDLIPLFQEHYDTAVKLAQASNLKFPYSHTDTEEEKTIEEIFRAFIADCNYFHLECWGIGEKKDKNEIIEEIGMHLKGFGRFSQDQARTLAIKVSNALLRKVNNHPNLRAYLKEYPFPASRIKMHIDFGNSRYCTYRDGSMASLDLQNNEISYYQDLYLEEDKGYGGRDHDILLLAKEPYPIASKMVDSSSFFSEISKYIRSWFRN